MADLSPSFTVPFPRPQVWEFFRRPELVVPCMPGASLTEPPNGNSLTGQMRVKLGPIAADFAGRAELTMDDANWSGSIQGRGLDKKNNSRARSDVRFALTEQPAGTLVAIDVDFTLTGLLAQFSRGAIVQEIARRVVREFAANLEAKMASQSAAVPAPPSKALNVGALLWGVIAGWFARIFRTR